ncbi:MAG TPA: hypothetical protein VGD37_42265, partial [Kofleriaceae bacterium]
ADADDDDDEAAFDGADDAYDDDEGDDDDDDDDDEAEGDEPGEADQAAAASEHAVAAAAPRDWTVRQLCSDGSCIGVIGSDGRCKVCGRPAAGSPATTPAATAEPASASTPTQDTIEVQAEVQVHAEPAGALALGAPEAPASLAVAADPLRGFLGGVPAGPPPPTAAREACADVVCTGAIGADGRCDVCGKGAS